MHVGCLILGDQANVSRATRATWRKPRKTMRSATTHNLTRLARKVPFFLVSIRGDEPNRAGFCLCEIGLPPNQGQGWKGCRWEYGNMEYGIGVWRRTSNTPGKVSISPRASLQEQRAPSPKSLVRASWSRGGPGILLSIATARSPLVYLPVDLCWVERGRVYSSPRRT